jgi:hypothetical protein
MKTDTTEVEAIRMVFDMVGGLLAYYQSRLPCHDLSAARNTLNQGEVALTKLQQEVVGHA